VHFREIFSGYFLFSRFDWSIFVTQLVAKHMKEIINTINNSQENKAKIKLKHQNLTSQILPVCLKRPYLQFLLKSTDFWCLFKNSVKFK
jgi:hypothetical protein